MQGKQATELGNKPTRGGDEGATLVEFAIVLPLLLLILFAILELGLAFRDVLTTSSAVRQGTRMLSALGNDPDADCEAVIATAERLVGIGNINNLDRIEIYKAESNGEQSSDPDYTNTYRFVGNDLTDCSDWTATTPWQSTSRGVVVGTGYELDLIGMRVIYTHDWITGFPPFSGSFTIDETTISRLEPEEFR